MTPGRPEIVLYLVDTSAWIEVFRPPARIDLESVIDLDEVVICLPGLQEVLAGFEDERAFQVAREAMHAFPIIEAPLEMAVFEEAVVLYRLARLMGVTVRSSVDCVVAVCAILNNLTVLHHDRDFDHLARAPPHRTREVTSLARP